ncbi:MAG TPA: hypothetical protein VKQ52_06795 [Puia sp.]|nr:hypothetical protein [Puia sp.]
MKTIKSITHLREEQLRLARRRASLESTIRGDWDTLRHHFEPAAYAREAFFNGLSWLGKRIFSTEGRTGRNRTKTHSS